MMPSPLEQSTSCLLRSRGGVLVTRKAHNLKKNVQLISPQPQQIKLEEIMNYSFKKGIYKGLLSLLAIGGGIIAFAGFSDLTIWGLLEQYLKPVLGSLTVGGVIAVAINFFKFKLGSRKTQ